MTAGNQSATARSSSETLAQIESFFDNYGDLWIDAYGDSAEAWYEYHPLRLRERYACAMVGEENRGTALDLGCGTGHALLMLKGMGFERVIGVDISERMVQEAKALIAGAGADQEISVLRADVTNLEMIETGSVDACTALGVIEYLTDDASLLSEVYRILKPGGAAVIQTRNAGCIRSRTVELGKRLVPRYRSKIVYREHQVSEFRRSAEASGFTIENALFAHFYALYPLDVIPGVRSLARPLDNFLSKKLERFAAHPGARRFASMYIPKLRKPAETPA
jgi:SAM-dependent methyltransferase